MTPIEFLTAFGKAKHGTYVPYAVSVGNLKDCPDAGVAAWNLYQNGEAKLFQRRISSGPKSKFDYLAFKL